MDSDLMRWVKAQADDPNANPRFRELLAALEAAREDAERYRWLREHDDRNLWEFKGAYHDIAELKRGKDLDAAIDQARGKGGQEVGGG